MKPAQSGCDVTEDDGSCCGRWGRWGRWVAIGCRSGARCRAVEGVRVRVGVRVTIHYLNSLFII